MDGPELEPLVGLHMDCVIFVAQLFGGNAFLQRLGLSRGSVLVRAANVQRPSISRSWALLSACGQK